MTRLALRLSFVLSRFVARVSGAPFNPLSFIWCIGWTALAFGANSAAAAPSVPTGLAASAVAGTSFTLTWSASTGSPTGYDVFKNAVSIGSTPTGNPPATTFNVTALTPNTTYSMTVKSKNASGSSAASAPLSVTTGPVAPTNLSATNKTATSFTLSWTGSTGAAAYEIFRNGTSIGSTPTGSRPATTFNVTGLTANTAYTMTVKAKNSATIPSDPSVALVVTSAPAAPTSLSATNKTATSFTLNWTGSAGAASYEIFRNGTSIGSTPTGSPPATTFNVTGLTANTAYSMTVKSKNAENTVSDPSTALSVTTSAAANQLPTVTLTAPAEGGVFTVPAPIALAATASDPDGTVSKVEFFEGANKLGQDTTSPYTFSWSATVPGTKSLTARATDNLGATKDSTAVSVRLLPSLPFTADFETSEGYVLGSLNGQRGWSVSGGSANIVASGAAHGTQSVLLGTGAVATEVAEDFGPLTANPLIVFVDFFAKPVAGVDFATGTLFDVDAARISFVKSGSAGQFAVLDGDGVGAGTWRNLGPALVLNASNITTAWVRVSLRLNYTAKTYDFYVNSQLAGSDFKFRRNDTTYLSRFSLKGHPSASVALDDIYAATANPLFTDADKDGIDDAWETAHGLNPAVDDRNLDPDGDGLSNIQEYRYGTDPIQADTDADGVSDSAEIASGSNPLVPNGGPGALPGLRLWLRSTAGTTGPGPLSRWVNQRLPGSDATQNDPDRRPAVVANQINGLPIVHFNQSQNQWLDLPGSLMATAQGGEAFAVVRRSSTPAVVGLWAWGTATGSRYPEGDGEIFDDFATTDRIQTGPAPSGLDDFHVYDVGGNNTTWFQTFNGKLHFRRSSNTVGFRNSPLLGNGDGCGFDGDIAEVLVYDHVLSEAERDSIGRYFTQKYALSAIVIPQKPALTAVSATSSIVDLNWSEPSSSSIHTVVTIERKAGGGSFAPIVELNDTYSYSDKGVLAGQTYTYRIKLTSWKGTSPYSDQVTLVQPETPTVPETNLRLWLRSTAGLPNSAPLTAWVNQVNPENSAFQVEPDRAPVLKKNQLNGFPVLHFDQSQFQWLNLPQNLMAGATGGEAFAVVRRSSTPEVVGLWSLGDGPGSRYPETTGEVNDDFASDSWASTGPAPTFLSQYHIYNVGGDGSRWFQAFNGRGHFQKQGNTVGFRSDPRIGDARGCLFDGDVAEVLIYDRILSEVERNSVHSYLANKYRPDSMPALGKPVLQAFAASATKVDLAWSALPTNMRTEMVIERSAGGSSFVTIATVSDLTSYTDIGLSAGQTYTYRARLKGYLGTSAYSEPAVVTTLTTAELPAAGLCLWLRSTAGTQGRGALSRWGDQSPAGNDAVQPERYWQPTVIQDPANNLPVVHFTQNHQNSLTLPRALMEGAAAGEAFVMLRRSTTNDIVGLWSLGAGMGSRYPEYNNRLLDDFATTTWYDTGPAPTGLTDFHLYNVGGDQTTWFQTINGQSRFQRNGNTVGFRPDPVIGDGQGCNFDGDIAEIIIYRRLLAPAERALVTQYLIQKYAGKLGPADLVPPSPPANLSFSQLTASSLVLDWTSSTDNVGVAGYDIFDNDLWVGSSSDTRFVVTGLTPGTTHRLTVTAKDAAGNSSGATPVLPVTTPLPDDTTPPTAPSGLATSGMNGITFILSWTPSTDNRGVIAYDIYRDGILVGSSPDASFVLVGLKKSTAYSMSVVARDAAGNASVSSAPLVVTTSATVTPPAGMRLWLRANAGAPTSGPVARWIDQSGRGNDALQADSDHKPSVLANQINGLPAVHFTLDDATFHYTWLDLPNLMAGTSGGEAFAVLRRSNLSNTVGLWAFGPGQGSRYPEGDGVVFDDFATSTWIRTPAAPVDLHEFHLYNVGGDQAAWFQNFNGRLHFRQIGNTPEFCPNPTIGGGSRFEGHGPVFDGDIAEVIIYDRVLTTVEREVVTTYLASKYALPAFVVPPKPVLNGFQASSGKVDLSWSAVPATTQGLTAVLERQTGSGAFRVLAEITHGSRFTDESVTADQVYTYRITLRSGAGVSPPSNPVTVSAVDLTEPPSAGMRLWLRSTACDPSGETMARWPDQSPSKNDAVQSDVAAQPRLVADAFGRFPAVRFAGSQNLWLSDAMSGAAAGEIIAVVKVQPKPSGQNNDLWAFGLDQATGYYDSFIHYNDFGSSRNQFLVPLPNSVLSQYHLFNTSSGGGSWVERVNGREQKRVTNVQVGFRSSAMIGCYNFTGEFAEIIVYDRALSAAEREAIGYYLDRKYGFGLAAVFGTHRDSNRDGLTDAQDAAYGFDPYRYDVDGDGVPNAVEIINRTDPFTADTDHDGVADGLDYYPLDASRWQRPAPDANDHSSPVVTLDAPPTATLN